MWTRNGSSTEDNSPLRAANLSLQSTFVRARNRPQFCMELWLAGQWSTCTSDEAVVRWKCTRDLSKRFLTNPCSRKFTAGGLKEIPYEDSTLLHGAVRQDSAKRQNKNESERKCWDYPQEAWKKKLWFWRVEHREGSDKTQPPMDSYYRTKCTPKKENIPPWSLHI